MTDRPTTALLAILEAIDSLNDAARAARLLAAGHHPAKYLEDAQQAVKDAQDALDGATYSLAKHAEAVDP